MIKFFKKQDTKRVSKGIKCAGALALMGMVLISSLASGNVAHAKDNVTDPVNVGGVHVEARVTDGRKSGKTTASIRVLDGPPISLAVEAKIYYRFNKSGYYTTSGRVSRSVPNLSKSVEKKRAGAEVDVCRGIYHAGYNASSWDRTLSVGKEKSGVKYKRE